MNSKQSPPPLHFILRYSDSLRDVDTYAAHKAIEARLGRVWWGKFGVGISRQYVDIVKEQIRSGKSTYVYLATKGRILYRARLLDIIGGGRRTHYRPAQLTAVPSYYRTESCTVWFKLCDLRRVPAADQQHLVLYNDRLFAPQLKGMRGLIYVTRGKPRKRSSPTRARISSLRQHLPFADESTYSNYLDEVVP